MHDVSLRASINLMDARNLALVLCPNLVRSSGPGKDLAMCAVPASSSPPPPNGETSLGAIIKFCIERYYEVFDEIRDRSEALPPPRPLVGSHTHENESDSGSSVKRVSHDYEEDVDDAMLVMPIGIRDSGSSSSAAAWGKPRHRKNQSSGSNPMSVRSMHTNAGDVGSDNVNNHVVHRAKSVITFEKDSSTGGAITIGRGGSRTRKASGAPAEALSISASGFFSAPNDTPKMPGGMD